MAGKTGSALITEVKDNLGSLASGTLGVRDIDTAILSKINLIQLDIIARHPTVVQMLKRVATVNVTSAADTYSIPTTDVDANTVEFVDFIALVLNDSTTHTKLEQLAAYERTQLFEKNDSSVRTAKPTHYMIFGNKFWLYPYPDATYTITCYGTILPTALEAGTSSVLGALFDISLIAGATYLTYLALQEPQDAAAWLSTFEKQLHVAISAMRTKTAWNILPNKEPVDSQPWNNPFVVSV